VSLGQETQEELAPAAGVPGSLWQRLTAGGTDGNSALTTATGALLLVLLALLGITVLAVHSLIDEHLFLGMLLLGPVALKLGSVGYRFTLYYTGNERYRRKGPPEMVMRVLAPFVVVSTLAVFLSGVVLLLAGPSSRTPWNAIHKGAFYVWLAVWWGHVILHLPDLPRLWSARTRERAWDDYGSGRGGRAVSLAGALLLGVVLAVVTIPLYGAWSGALH
jgi:hypothetical protein